MSQFVVLANVIPDTGVLSSLEASLDLAAAVQVLQENYHTSRTQLGPLLPRTAPWVKPEINANPLVEQVVVRLLGGEAFIRWHGSNTSLPMPPDAPALSAEAAAGWEARPEDGMQHLHMRASLPPPRPHRCSVCLRLTAGRRRRDGWGWSMPEAHPTYKIFW